MYTQLLKIVHCTNEAYNNNKTTIKKVKKKKKKIFINFASQERKLFVRLV